MTHLVLRKYALSPKFATCLFHTCISNYGQAKMMKKLLKGTSNSKRKNAYYEAPILPSPEAFTKGAFEGKRSSNSRRVSVLNKLFMRHITDLLATGENASEYAGLGLEINKVRVTPDFKLVQVFWFSKDESDGKIEKLLSRNAGGIRYELTALRVLGIVPKIQFLKDKVAARMLEVEKQLGKADFGEDHVPVDPVSMLKIQLELDTTIEPNIKEKLLEVDASYTEEIYEPIPQMPQNVFGLNHADIMLRVKKSLVKAQAGHRKCTVERGIESITSVNDDPLKFEDGMSQKEALKKFLLKRQLLKYKAGKENKNYTPDAEYIREELEARYKENLQKFEDDFEDERDYIEEDEK